MNDDERSQQAQKTLLLTSASVAEDRFNMWTQDGSAKSRILCRLIPKHLPWVHTAVLSIPHTALVEFLLSEQMKMSVCLFFCCFFYAEAICFRQMV